MKKYERIKKLCSEEFRRLTGIKPATFQEMVVILKEAEKKKKSQGGKPNNLGIEDMLLMGFGISERI